MEKKEHSVLRIICKSMSSKQTCIVAVKAQHSRCERSLAAASDGWLL